jgi:Putative threonine efflux protein
MLDTIIKGLFIGILVSAPMGPIGVLCIQRTLREGRLHGFISGIGATFSDLVYAIISGLGVSFIMDFIQQNHYPLQIAGSLLLLVAGYFIYKSNPAKKLLIQDEKKSPYWKNFISSFFINLSNIGILFFFIAMFARFNFIDPVHSSQNIIGIISIGIGTIIWWLLISTIVDKVRTRFNPRGLKVFNNILGVVLILIGIVGIISGTYSLIEMI